MKKLEFGKRLVEVRKAKGLTQEEVAEKCKITVRTIQRIESGAVHPRAFTIKAISEVLGFDFFETSNTGYDEKRKNKSIKLENTTLLWYVRDLFNLKTNAMKKISILSTLSIMVGFLFVFIFDATAQSNNKSNNSLIIQLNEDKSIRRIEAAFTNTLTFDSLIHIKNELKVRGISINYTKLEFDSKKRLLNIDCEIDCNDGYSGSFGIGSLNKQKKGERFGFYRDYSKSAKSPFGTGQIN